MIVYDNLRRNTSVLPPNFVAVEDSQRPVRQIGSLTNIIERGRRGNRIGKQVYFFAATGIKNSSLGEAPSHSGSPMNYGNGGEELIAKPFFRGCPLVIPRIQPELGSGANLEMIEQSIKSRVNLNICPTAIIVKVARGDRSRKCKHSTDAVF